MGKVDALWKGYPHGGYYILATRLAKSMLWAGLPRRYSIVNARLTPTIGSGLSLANELHTTLPLPSKLRQIDGLQVLRAVAVLLVAWLHAGQWLWSLSSSHLPGFGVYGIDLFFVISGFIVSSIVLRTKQAPGPRAMWEFLKRRLIRIFPIYWLFALLEVARFLLAHRTGLRNYIPIFFLLPGLGYPEIPLLVDFSWTMVFEMFFYYSLAAVLLATVRRAVPVSIAFFCLAIVVGRFVGIQRPVWIIVCNPILLEFVFGAIVALAYSRFGRRRYLGIAMFGLGVAASFCLTAFPSVAATGLQMVLADAKVVARTMTWGLAAVLVVGGTVFWSPSVQRFPGRVAVVLGNASYSAYLASSLVIEFTMRLLIKVWGGRVPLSAGRVASYQTIGAVAVFAVGWLCYQFIEWPMLRWLQRKLLTPVSDGKTRI
ncbi:MAG: acyltransferase [Acidobacteriaceae bacterium]